jgi:hypothetical protein
VSIAADSSFITDLEAPLPLPATNFDPKLTRSALFFSLATGINPLALSIATQEEFILFMEMRAQHQWKSYEMTSRRWVAAAELYNSCLVKQNEARHIPTVSKKPRALMEKLGEVELKVIERILTGNYKCEFYPGSIGLGSALTSQL